MASELPTSLALEVATPLGMALLVQTDSVQVPSVAGELGVLPGHVPLLAALKPGILSYRDGGQMIKAAVGGGYVEVTAARVQLIAEFFLKKDQIDLEAAQKDLAEAETRLKQTTAKTDDVEYQEAQREYDWAQARIALASSATN